MTSVSLHDYVKEYRWRYRGFRMPIRHETFLSAHPELSDVDADAIFDTAREMIEKDREHGFCFVLGCAYLRFTAEPLAASDSPRRAHLIQRFWADGDVLARVVILVEPGPGWLVDWSAGRVPPPLAWFKSRNR